MAQPQLPRRAFRDGVNISCLGLGGLALTPLSETEARKLVDWSLERGVTYFDVGPTYPVDDLGRCERLLGQALRGRREEVFLACKTTERSAEGAAREMGESLERLETGGFDLYQLHGVGTVAQAEAILAKGGAAQAFLKAREEGLFRFFGMSVHSEKAAVLLFRELPIDSVLFPVNAACLRMAGFGERIMALAKEKGAARLAIKALAHRTWPAGTTPTYPYCWYQPYEEPGEAALALAFALGQDITAAIPPADAGLFRMCVELVLAGLPEAPRGEVLDAFLERTESVPIFTSG